MIRFEEQEMKYRARQDDLEKRLLALCEQQRQHKGNNTFVVFPKMCTHIKCWRQILSAEKSTSFLTRKAGMMPHCVW